MSLCQTSSFESNFSLCLRYLAHQTNWMGYHKIFCHASFQKLIDRLHHCNHRCSFLNVFRLDKVSKVGQGDFNFSSHQQSVQNFKLEAASLLANSHSAYLFLQRFLRNINVMTKGKQSVQNFNIEAASLMANNGQAHIHFSTDFCPTTMTKGKLFSL